MSDSYDIYPNFNEDYPNQMMMLKKTAFILLTIVACAQATAQGQLKISGYVQGQAQWGGAKAKLNVGEASQGDEAFSRIGIRRGHLKFIYETGLAKAVFQLDATERKVGLKDAYLQIGTPREWLGRSALRVGLFDRPFGYEIGYSSSKRESPERAAIFPTLFPGERDLGAMIILQPRKSSPLHFLKLKAGLFAGNGINPEHDNRRDFIGRLSAQNSIGKHLEWGLGTSYYHGWVLQTTDRVYDFDQDRFRLISGARSGDYALRQYVGWDAQLAWQTPLGKTHLRAEYIVGQQPSSQDSHHSPATSKPSKEATYLRQIAGGYAMLVQEIKGLPCSLIVKYDWLDPNTEISADAVGTGGTTTADAALGGLGLGLLWQIDKTLRLQAYYDMRHNERSTSLKGYETDRSDDAFTLRLQYKF